MHLTGTMLARSPRMNDRPLSPLPSLISPLRSAAERPRGEERVNMSSRNTISVLALVASGALACAGCAAQSEDPVEDRQPVVSVDDETQGDTAAIAPSPDADPAVAERPGEST